MATEGSNKIQKVVNLKKKTSKNLINKDENGEIQYPIVINNSLVI
jgi:hypothetical protein